MDLEVRLMFTLTSQRVIFDKCKLSQHYKSIPITLETIVYDVSDDGGVLLDERVYVEVARKNL